MFTRLQKQEKGITGKRKTLYFRQQHTTQNTQNNILYQKNPSKTERARENGKLASKESGATEASRNRSTC
jgi:hypothetical protein